MKISKQSIGKKFTLIICLALLGNMVNAQFFRNYFYLTDNYYDENLGSLYVNKQVKKEGVNEIFSKSINPKNKKITLNNIQKFNANGVCYFYQNLDKKGRIYLTRTCHLIDTLRFDKMEYAYKKDTFTTINIFNDQNKIIETQNFRKNNVKTWTNKYTYNDKNKLATSIGIGRKGKQAYKNEYDYYDNGSRKETRYYNKKNKLEKIYSYACEPTGVVEKKVTQQNICKKRTYNPDSSYFEIFEGHDNKGHSSRRVVKYSKDSLDLEETYYNNNDKETRRYVSEYKDRKTVNFQYFYKGKLKRAYHYNYNSKGLIENYVSTNRKGKVKNNIVYEYSYF